MTFISEPGLDKRNHAEKILGGTPSMEDIVQKVAELEYLEEVEVYKVQRAAEYPDFGTQLDYIYHNGVDSWKTNVVDPVKAKYSKVEVDADELSARKAAALAEYQLEEYTKALKRLSRYRVITGREEVTEDVVLGEEYNEETNSMDQTVDTIVTEVAIEAQDETITIQTIDEDHEVTTSTIENPLITQDNAERAEAQAIVDATPQAVINTYSGEIK